MSSRLLYADDDEEPTNATEDVNSRAAFRPNLSPIHAIMKSAGMQVRYEAAPIIETWTESNIILMSVRKRLRRPKKFITRAGQGFLIRLTYFKVC